MTTTRRDPEGKIRAMSGEGILDATEIVSDQCMLNELAGNDRRGIHYLLREDNRYLLLARADL